MTTNQKTTTTTTMKANADAHSAEFKSLARRGFKFLVEFGDPCSDPVPGMGYFCRTLKDARNAYRDHKNEGELFSVKALQDGGGFEPYAQGWVS